MQILQDVPRSNTLILGEDVTNTFDLRQICGMQHVDPWSREHILSLARSARKRHVDL